MSFGWFRVPGYVCHRFFCFGVFGGDFLWDFSGRVYLRGVWLGWDAKGRQQSFGSVCLVRLYCRWSICLCRWSYLFNRSCGVVSGPGKVFVFVTFKVGCVGEAGGFVSLANSWKRDDSCSMPGLVGFFLAKVFVCFIWNIWQSVYVRP